MHLITALARTASIACILAALFPAGLSAQLLPSGPVRLLDGRLTLGGEIVATAGARDDETFFNYTDYEHNALRLFRAALSGAWRPAERIAVLGELRTEDFDGMTAFAAYVRIRPFPERRFDIQAGRIPPTFGAFGRRAYTGDNPLVGYPLAYQYLTSLRADAVPATADDLIRMRARGWRSSFPIGSPTAESGIPLVSAFRWDTGVQARVDLRALELSAAVTTGTLSNPRVADDNGGKQIAARAALRPSPGWVLGASAARGAWLSDDVPLSGSRGSFTQRTLGADAEYSRDHWLVRAEAVHARWALPFGAWSGGGDVSAWGAWVEARYRVTPRLFAAGRADHLGFSRIRPSSGAEIPWDAPVDRLEAVAGYYLQRNVTARVALQTNWREAGRTRRRTFAAVQLAWWF